MSGAYVCDLLREVCMQAGFLLLQVIKNTRVDVRLLHD